MHSNKLIKNATLQTQRNEISHGLSAKTVGVTVHNLKHFFALENETQNVSNNGRLILATNLSVAPTVGTTNFDNFRNIRLSGKLTCVTTQTGYAQL